jgi:hypothetical protein
MVVREIRAQGARSPFVKHPVLQLTTNKENTHMRNFTSLSYAEKQYNASVAAGVDPHTAAATASERIKQAHENTRAQSEQHTEAGDGSILADGPTVGGRTFDAPHLNPDLLVNQITEA